MNLLEKQGDRKEEDSVMLKAKKKWVAVSLIIAILFVMINSPTHDKSSKAETQNAIEFLATPAPSITPVPSATVAPLATPYYDYGVSNPTISNGVTTWDCVYFGNYWQNDTDGDGNVDHQDDKEPIKWRVLSVDGNDAFLMADQCLDAQPYNEEDEDVTWETCTLRTWLNDTFLYDAFSANERSAIRYTMVVNEDNSYYGTEGGNNTLDYVYLLSEKEVCKAKYGFSEETINLSSTAREAKNTAYAKRGAYTSSGNGYWWLRSPGSKNNSAMEISASGEGDYSGYTACNYGDAVRPVLHINLYSSEWSFAGTVTSDGVITTPTPTPQPTVAPQPTSTPSSYFGINNPSISNGVTTWDCVYFGNYWQNDTDGDGNVDHQDDKEPIKWRVLSVDGNDAFLMADQCLDAQPYNEEDEDVTWETCTLRTWLNDTFLYDAFSANERSAIRYTMVVNEDNSYYGTEGGNNTLDYVYLLSEKEVCKAKYGFSEETINLSSTAREAKNTAYAKRGAYTSSGNGYWWLRSPGSKNNSAMEISASGEGDYSGYTACNYGDAVRPVLHINLYSSEWSFAGTVTSDGVITTPTPTPSPTMTPTPTPTVAPTPTPEITPGCVTMPPTPTPVIVPSQSPTQTTPAPVIPPTYPTTTVTAITEEEEQDEANPEWDEDYEEEETATSKKTTKKTVTQFTVKGLKYKVLKNTSKKRTVAIVGVAKKGQKKYDIPLKVKFKGKNFQIVNIRKNAFKGCRKTKYLYIRSKTIQKIDKGALNGLSKKCNYKIIKSRMNKYRKMILKSLK